MFSPFALSVRADWDAARKATVSNEVNGVTDAYLRQLWADLDEPADLARRRTRADLLILNAIRVRLARGDPALAARMTAVGRELAELVDHRDVRVAPLYPTLSTQMQALMDAPVVLQARVSLAVALTLEQPQPPDPTQLLRGVDFMAGAYRALPRPLPRDSGSHVPLGIVAALLARRPDLARELVDLRSSHADWKRQFAMLKALVKWAQKHAGDAGGACPVEDPKLQRMFFEVFNAYRLPLHPARAAALAEFTLGSGYSIIDAYLYAWLYWLYFADTPRLSISWDDMIEVITS